MRTVSVKSFAKINISLRVVNKRSDGYHELDSIMVPIELHDSIIISPLFNSGDNFVTVDDFSNGLIHYNLASASIDALAKEYGFKNKFRIYIHKVIPMQAGLGGGSSNAAFTMKAVNNMLKLNASEDKIIELCTPLGADIPFFVKCVPARCRGVGEKMEPINIKNNYSVLIVKPNAGCSTKEVFAIADQKEFNPVDIDTVIKALEEAAVSLVPEIQEIKNILKEAGLKIVLMSGSGSTVFALSTDTSLIKKVAKSLEDKYFVAVTKIRK